MLCCVVCKSYSHGDCYKSFILSTIHVCAKCALKTGRPCTNARVLDRFSKSEKSKSDRKLWVFDLMKRRVMKSILNEEFKSIQPGLVPDETFLRLRFQLSESYATRVLFSLVKDGAIILYGGFKYDKQRLLSLLNLPVVYASLPSPPLVIPSSNLHPAGSPSTIHSATLDQDHSTPRSILKSTPPSKLVLDDSTSSPQDTSNPSSSLPGNATLIGQVKKIRWDSDRSPLQNPFVDSSDECVVDCDSAASLSSSPRPSIINSSSIQKPLQRQDGKEPPCTQPCASSTGIESSQTVPRQKQFQNHYVWPERFMARECRFKISLLLLNFLFPDIFSSHVKNLTF